MKNNRQIMPQRNLDLRLQGLDLILARTKVIMVIQTNLANGDNLGRTARNTDYIGTTGKLSLPEFLKGE